MNRTWRDAACEVAWNLISGPTTNKPIIGSWDNLNIPLFLKGVSDLRQHDDTLCGIGLNADYKFYSNFPAFRTAFMKWLSDNEVKK